MPSALAGKVALVTGAARGIGRAVTVSLAQAGADVVALDWRPGKPDENGLDADFRQTEAAERQCPSRHRGTAARRRRHGDPLSLEHITTRTTHTRTASHLASLHTCRLVRPTPKAVTMTDSTTPTTSHKHSWSASAAGSTYGGDDYSQLLNSLRSFLDLIVGAKPTLPDLRRLATDLEEWNAVLAETQVGEEEQVYFRRNDLPDRGQCFVPVFVPHKNTPEEISGSVTFGRYYLGGGGAAHGGAVSLLLDSAMGSFSNSHNRTPSRTAYLNVAFTALTPIDEPLELTIRVDREEGRKRFLVGELRRGYVVCARAEGLFIALREDQA